MEQKRAELCYSADQESGAITFFVPDPGMKADRFHRDLERLQWFADKHGYEQNSQQFVGTFGKEEFVAAVRYLNKFGWVNNATRTCGPDG